MSDYPRRRRLEPDEPPGGFPIFPLILIVIFAGLLLGGLIAHFSQKNDRNVATASPLPAITPIATGASATVTPPASATSEPSGSASPSATPSSKPSATASASPSASVKPTPTQAPPARSPVIFITPAPTPKAKPVEPAEATASTLATSDAEGPNISSNDAGGVVRGYLSALVRGDESSAASYLASGLPTESFMSGAAKVVSVNSTKNGDGSFKVSADISTPSGEYFETFTVQSGANGLQITDHTAIKPQ